MRYLGSLSPSGLSRRKSTTWRVPFVGFATFSSVFPRDENLSASFSGEHAIRWQPRTSLNRNLLCQKLERRRGRERERAKTVLAFATGRKRIRGRSGSFCQFPFRRTPFLFIPFPSSSFCFPCYPPTRRPAGFQLSFPMETRTVAPDHSTVPKHSKTFNRKQRWDSILARASTSDDEDKHVRRENVRKMYKLRVQL